MANVPDVPDDVGAPWNCRCGAALESRGVREFRTGGTTGGWKLLVGEWAELGEGMMALEVLACPHCGRVEMRLPRK